MSRKAADLNTLIRLKRWFVDERRRALGALINREEQLILERQGLDRQMLHEAKIMAADPTQAGFAFGNYAKGHRLRREQMDRHLAAIKDEIEVARQELEEAYRERKVLEEVQTQRSRAEQDEANRIDQIAMDEIAQTQFRLRNG